MSGNRGRAPGGRPLTLLLAVGVAVAVGAARLRVVGTGASRWMFVALSFLPYALAGAGFLTLGARA